MSLVVNGPHTLWADCGGGNGRKDVAAVARLSNTALSYKISEGRGYIDPNGQYHHDAALANGMLPIPYVFPLPAGCGMSVTDQAKRDADLIHTQHGSFNNIGVMLDLEEEPGNPGWGPWLMNASDVAAYISTFKSLTGMKVGGYTGYMYQYSGHEGFDWRVIPNYSYAGPLTDLNNILYNLNGGVTWMPPNGWYRQFTDAVNVSGTYTDFNVAPVDPVHFLAAVSGSVVPPKPKPPQPWPNRYASEYTIQLGANDWTFPLNVHPVKDWQGGLNSVSNAGLSVDGNFGPATQGKTMNFQEYFHLKVDGVVGPQTWAQLALILDIEGK